MRTHHFTYWILLRRRYLKFLHRMRYMHVTIEFIISVECFFGLMLLHNLCLITAFVVLIIDFLMIVFAHL